MQRGINTRLPYFRSRMFSELKTETFISQVLLYILQLMIKIINKMFERIIKTIKTNYGL